MIHAITNIILWLFFIISMSFMFMLLFDTQKQKGMIITVGIFLILSIALLIIFHVISHNIPEPIGTIMVV